MKSFFNKIQHFKFVKHILRIALALGITIFVTQMKLDFIEFYFYDLKFRYKPQPSISPQIELIHINANTLQALKTSPDFNLHKDFLQILKNENPLAIVYDFNTELIKGNNSDKKKWLLETQNFQHFIIATKSPDIGNEDKQSLMPFPLNSVTVIPAPKTADISNFAKDGVTRRMMLDYQGQIMLQPYLASLIQPKVLNFTENSRVFDFFDTHQALIDFAKDKSYPRMGFEQVLAGQFSPGRFTNKIVFVGEDLGISEEDYLLTPYSRDVNAMTRIEMQANIVDTLLRDSFPTMAPQALDKILVFCISLLTIYIVLALKPVKGLALLVGTFLGYSLIAYLVFMLWRVHVSTAGPLIAIFICYYFFIPYRLILEHRKSWEYYEKNKLLRQVEELKTNFISMMSHDLKTPIARILGMTDIISRDSTAILSAKQREALDTIKQSSDDLLKFISAILEYGKIEMDGVQIKRQSRDINSLIQEVIKKHEFLAKLKYVKIETELEPLFPIFVDPDLVKQVFSNLLENAIKYSAENSLIRIKSKEVDNKVSISFADQGFGIPDDELSNIFMKFFRSKSAKTSPIKGTGLGLYLSKYFIELHGGQIFVESTYGQGSIFRVELPIESRGMHA